MLKEQRDFILRKLQTVNNSNVRRYGRCKVPCFVHQQRPQVMCSTAPTTTNQFNHFRPTTHQIIDTQASRSFYDHVGRIYYWYW
jgi:hypothetical protein